MANVDYPLRRVDVENPEQNEECNKCRDNGHTQRGYLPCEHCMQMCISAVCPTVSLSARVYLPELRLFIVLVYVPSS